MRFLTTVSAVLTVAVLAVGCAAGGGEPAVAPAPTGTVLGSDGSGSPAECPEAVVRRTADSNVLELTIIGRAGEIFDYEVLLRDGSTVNGTTGPFGPQQQEAVLTTGVANADVDTVTFSADGPDGTGGSCVITTVR